MTAFLARRAALNSAPAFAGEGDHSAAPNGGGAALTEAGLSAEALTEAAAGMAEMSKVFRETGSELHMGAGGRERD